MVAYIKFDGIDGELMAKGHEKWSDLMSFSQSINKTGGAPAIAARRRGTPILEDVACVKLLDKSSPKIAEAVCHGKVFPKVEIHCKTPTTDASRETFYKDECQERYGYQRFHIR